MKESKKIFLSSFLGISLGITSLAIPTQKDQDLLIEDIVAAINPAKVVREIGSIDSLSKYPLAFENYIENIDTLSQSLVIKFKIRNNR